MRYNDRMLLTFLSTSLAFYVTAMALPGFRVKGAAGALIAAAVFGLLQWALGGLLFGLIGILTLGLGVLLRPLTRLVISWLLLMLADNVTDKLSIRDKGTALIGALAITALSEVFRWAFGIVL